MAKEHPLPVLEARNIQIGKLLADNPDLLWTDLPEIYHCSCDVHFAWYS